MKPARATRRAALGLLLALAPALAPAEPPPAPIRVQDDLGRTVDLPGPARRAITLTPHATELAYAAGAGPYLVGTVRASDHPAAARALPSIGDALQPDPERVAQLRPDLILAWQPATAGGLTQVAGKLGAAVFYSDPVRLDDIPLAIERYGRLFGTSAQADAEAGRLRARLAALRGAYAGKAPVRVFVQAGTDPLYTLNDSSIVSDALKLCGGVNVFGPAPVVAPQVSLESVLAARPDAVIAGVQSAAEAESLQRRWRESRLPAALAGHVYALDADALYRPGPRLVDATAALCEMLDRARS
ncbi:cobalamin-binding protein [Bordetella genomosp. 1]|uniref:Cobalamin-binding protein n=1 Tax=Bordetella genomosp. 1 TaxID=1395607 RepID=A0A261SU58_9BORD|nr:cobalamin-binding protein [Bordetella genomosp. 1]OZI40685.1 cobalamin-binding protein [Bordetella genomosp. 1]